MLQESGMPAFGAWPSSEAFGYFRLAEGHVTKRRVTWNDDRCGSCGLSSMERLG
jgi:hypothetical protein